jgi:tRNA-specific 2-thiouridylase
VRRGERDGKTCLLKGLDANKDQSYFLHAVAATEIEQTLFPVGELEKPEVRRIAEANNLITHNKKDSTGICFIGERRFKDFLQQYLPAQPGRIETPEGEDIGEHQGLMYHTLGQRQGLGIGGLKNHPDAPWFVAGKDLERNVLIAVQGIEHPLLFKEWLTTDQVFWVNEEPSPLPLQCKAKVRYRQDDQDCTIYSTATGYRVEFSKPQRAITPGQSVVFYLDDNCLGGGVIEQTGNLNE